MGKDNGRRQRLRRMELNARAPQTCGGWELAAHHDRESSRAIQSPSDGYRPPAEGPGSQEHKKSICLRMFPTGAGLPVTGFFPVAGRNGRLASSNMGANNTEASPLPIL